MISRPRTVAGRDHDEERFTPYRCQLNSVKSNFSLDGSDVSSSFIYQGVVNSHYNDLTSEIFPLMLLPKIRPRTEEDFGSKLRRPNIVEQCTERKQFANLASSNDDLTVTSLSRTRPMMKRSQSRDSGISSLKLFSLFNSTYSWSTLNESSHNWSAIDDGHSMSPYSNVGENIAVSISINRLNTSSESHGGDTIDGHLLEEPSSAAKRTKEENSLKMRIKSPEFLDSFADERPTVRLQKRGESQSEKNTPQNARRRGRNGQEIRKMSSANNCIFCRNITKHFGGIQKFINWLYSRWGKVSCNTLIENH